MKTSSILASRIRHLGVLSLILLVQGLTDSAFAAPANPAGRDVVQPDGTKFTLHLRGDEFFSWTETSDGYSIVKDADGFWKYALPATNRVAFIAIPTARVGTTDPALIGLVRHAMPNAGMLRDLIEERRRAMMTEPEELPIPQTVTNGNTR